MDQEIIEVDPHLSITDAVAELMKRFDADRTTGRDVDALTRYLTQVVITEWSDDPDAAVACGIETLFCLAAGSDAEATGIGRQGEHAFAAIVVRWQDALLAGGQATLADARRLAEAMEGLPQPHSQILADTVYTCADDSAKKILADMLSVHVNRPRSNLQKLLVKTQTEGAIFKPAPHREPRLLLARLKADSDGADAGFVVLEAEPAGDARVLETYAHIYREDGRLPDAIDRLKRATIVMDDPTRIHEALLDIHLEADDIDAALEQLMLLIRLSNNVLYWHIVGDLVGDDADLFAQLAKRLQDESASLYAEVLMTEGDIEAVKEASKGKTFSFQQLWKIGDFLQEHSPREASKLYERAIVLQCSVAHSKLQVQDLVQRMRKVIPFFDRIGRKTKPRRIARELLTKYKTNQPLRRELLNLFPKL